VMATGAPSKHTSVSTPSKTKRRFHPEFPQNYLVS
jgi:hypothetical protein